MVEGDGAGLFPGGDPEGLGGKLVDDSGDTVGGVEQEAEGLSRDEVDGAPGTLESVAQVVAGLVAGERPEGATEGDALSVAR